jgi:hypothetical protein
VSPGKGGERGAGAATGTSLCCGRSVRRFRGSGPGFSSQRIVGKELMNRLADGRIGGRYVAVCTRSRAAEVERWFSEKTSDPEYNYQTSVLQRDERYEGADDQHAIVSLL